MDCPHNNLDEYFDKCADCGAKRVRHHDDDCPEGCESDACWIMAESTPSRLPVIVGKPYTPKRTTKPHDRIDSQYTCRNTECKDAKPHATKPDGTHTHWQPTQNGSGWLERKANGEIVYHTPWLKPHIPFRNTTAGKNLSPKPRVETSAKALARMRKECVVPNEGRCHELTGKPACKGYVFVATNGHWALLEASQGTLGSMPFMEISDKHEPSTLPDPELYCALQRAAVMADERSKSVAVMSLDHETVALYASHSDHGDMMETVKANNNDRPWGFSANHEYLETVLGCWPLTVYVRDSESSIVFEPADKSWRYVLMPLRGELETVKKTVRNAQRQMEAEREAEDAPVWGGY